MFWLKAVALLKTPYMSVTDATFHASGWLNTVAPEKRFIIQSTLAVFQLPMGWLKAVAELKVPRRLATLATFHLARFWLKADADANDMCMCNTEATFQPPISALKLEAL
jgi:hypothetical protein